ncbi:lipase family protein [Burkholderia sp. Bp9004]|uniref:lipase family protein n=1 Tax=Burkholderia sp. Bp9004 TaxID=2184559 RepID=UPI0016396328|nr:hypothetical protein [Burkholderia sp. Bp9004]
MEFDQKVQIGLAAARWCSRATKMLLPDEDFKNRTVVSDGKVVQQDSAHDWAAANGWLAITGTFERLEPTVWALMAKEGDDVTIAFRGTSFASDWMTYNSPLWDALPQALEFFRGGHWRGAKHDMPDFPAQLGVGPNGYEAPSGFLTLYFVLRNALLSTYKSLIAHTPPKRILIFGHSLGCTAAQFLYVDLLNAYESGAFRNESRPQFTVGLLASPRCFVKRTLPIVPSSDAVVRFEVLTDPVPSVPKYGVSRQIFEWEVGFAGGGKSPYMSSEELVALGDHFPIWGAGDARTLHILTKVLLSVASRFPNLAQPVANAAFRWAPRILHHFIQVYEESLQSMASQPAQPLGVVTHAALTIRTADKFSAGTDNPVTIDFAEHSTRIDHNFSPNHKFQQGDQTTIDLQVDNGWVAERLRETRLVVKVENRESAAPQWLPKRVELVLSVEGGPALQNSWEFEDLWVDPKSNDSNQIIRSVWPSIWQRPLLVDATPFSLQQSIASEKDNRRKFFDVQGNPTAAENNTNVVAFAASSDGGKQRNRQFHAIYDEGSGAYRIFAAQIKTSAGEPLSIHMRNKSLDGSLVLHEPDFTGGSLEFWIFLPLGEGDYHIVLKQRPDLSISDDGDRLRLTPLQHGGQHRCWRLDYI